MDLFNKLKDNVSKIKDKYSYQKNNISGYLKEINDTFYEYAGVTDNFSYERVFDDIILGDACECFYPYTNPKSYYYFKGTNEILIEEVDYELLTELVDEALELTEEYEKTKQKDNDIC